MVFSILEQSVQYYSTFDFNNIFDSINIKINMIMDYGFLFEKIVKEVFGHFPKGGVYFANFYPVEDRHKYILYTICMYLLYYRNMGKEVNEKLEDYILSDEAKYLNDSDVIEMLHYLEHVLNIK